MEKEIIVKQIIYACEMPVSYETKKAIISESLDAYEQSLKEHKIEIKPVKRVYNRVKSHKKGYKQHQTPSTIKMRKRLIRLALKYSHAGYSWSDSLKKAHKRVYR